MHCTKCVDVARINLGPQGSCSHCAEVQYLMIGDVLYLAPSVYKGMSDYLHFEVQFQAETWKVNAEILLPGMNLHQYSTQVVEFNYEASDRITVPQKFQEQLESEMTPGVKYAFTISGKKNGKQAILKVALQQIDLSRTNG